MSEVDGVELSVRDAVDVCPPGQPRGGDPLRPLLDTDGLVIVLPQV